MKAKLLFGALIIFLLLAGLPLNPGPGDTCPICPTPVMAQGPGAPAYQILLPNGEGGETGILVFPPKLQITGKDNWLAVQSPAGLTVTVGEYTRDADNWITAIDENAGPCYIDNTSGDLVITAGHLSDKCSYDIEVADYTLEGGELYYDNAAGKEVYNQLTATFRSYVYGSGSDLYLLEDAPQIDDARGLPVVSITAHAIVRGTVTKSSAATRIGTGGKKYNGPTIDLGVSDDQLISTTYTLNPDTGVEWTWGEVNDLQAGVTLKDSAECSYVYVEVETEVHSQTFFPIDGVDVTPSTSDSWEDVDCSSYIPAGATGVVLHTHMDFATGSFEFSVRKNGSTDDRTNTMGNYYHCYAMVGVDASRIFECYVGDKNKNIVWLIGYTMSGVTFFTNAYDMTGTINTWDDIDCSTECPSADGLIFEFEGSSYGDMTLRNNGSSDTLETAVAHHNSFGHIVGCDSSQICEFRYTNAASTLWLLGYVTDGCTFYTNRDDVSLGSPYQQWTDLDALPTDSVMGFFWVINADINYRPACIRENDGGHAGDINDGQVPAYDGGIDAFVECDASYICEGYIYDGYQDMYVIGYAVAPSGCSPSIELDQSSWSVNGGTPVDEDTAYYTGITWCTITNNSGGSVDITIAGTDMTGGTAWDLTNDGTNGNMIYGMKSGLDDDDDTYDVVVREDGPYNQLVDSLADSGTQDFGLWLLTPDTYTDGVTKSSTVTLTAVCE